MAAKPLPRITAINRPFWTACNEDVLLLQRCASPECGGTIFYPRVCCPHCGGGETEWFKARTTGRVITYTIVQRPHHESFYDEAPFVFAAIQLDDGVMMYSRVECDAANVTGLIGQKVEAVFRALGPGQKAPYFRIC